MTAPLSPKKRPTLDPRCGTRAGYAAHRRRNETTCRACRDAHNDKKRGPRTSASKPPTDHLNCGTSSGAARHARLGESFCEPCRLARIDSSRRANLPAGEPPTSADLEGASCHPPIKIRDGLMLHDGRQPHEPLEHWRARLKQARQVCRSCPVFDACRRLDEHSAHRPDGVDGILAGQPAGLRNARGVAA